VRSALELEPSLFDEEERKRGMQDDGLSLPLAATGVAAVTAEAAAAAAAAAAAVAVTWKCLVPSSLFSNRHRGILFVFTLRLLKPFSPFHYECCGGKKLLNGRLLSEMRPRGGSQKSALTFLNNQLLGTILFSSFLFIWQSKFNISTLKSLQE